MSNEVLLFGGVDNSFNGKAPKVGIALIEEGPAFDVIPSGKLGEMSYVAGEKWHFNGS